MASAKTANWIRNNVPGIHIPDAVIKRLEGAQDQKKEGKQLCIDIINEVKEIKGVSGVHVMAYRQEEYVAEIVHESGVLKGRTPWKREENPGDSMVAAAAGTAEGRKDGKSGRDGRHRRTSSALTMPVNNSGRRDIRAYRNPFRRCTRRRAYRPRGSV